MPRIIKILASSSIIDRSIVRVQGMRVLLICMGRVARLAMALTAPANHASNQNRALRRYIAMKVLVDHKLCEGNGRCIEVASEVFELRDDDRSYVRVERPAANLRSNVRLAASLCPRQAIRLIED